MVGKMVRKIKKNKNGQNGFGLKWVFEIIFFTIVLIIFSN